MSWQSVNVVRLRIRNDDIERTSFLKRRATDLTRRLAKRIAGYNLARQRGTLKPPKSGITNRPRLFDPPGRLTFRCAASPSPRAQLWRGILPVALASRCIERLP